MKKLRIKHKLIEFENNVLRLGKRIATENQEKMKYAEEIKSLNEQMIRVKKEILEKKIYNELLIKRNKELEEVFLEKKAPGNSIAKIKRHKRKSDTVQTKNDNSITIENQNNENNDVCEENDKNTALINGEKTKILIDLGRQVNLISSELIKRKGLPEFEIENTNLKTVFEFKSTTNKATIETITHQNITVTDTFLITELEDEEKIIIGKELSGKIEKIIVELETLKAKFPTVFDEKTTEGYPDFKCKIETQNGKKVSCKYKSIAQAYIEPAKATINKLFENKYITYSKSSWSNLIRPVIKGDGIAKIVSNMIMLKNR